MKYDLVFEGGGAKGMVFVGAMQVFEAQGHTPGRLLGASAGAITAALLAAGYTSAEMLEALAEKKAGRSVFSDFLGPPGAFDKAAIRASATRELLRRINLPFIPDVIEDKLDDQLAEWLATQPSLRHVFSFVERGGWYSADDFIAWLQRRLDSGAHHGQPRRYSALTLAQFHAATQADLSLIASDTTAGQMLVLNHRTAPDLPLVWAVRMSMSIPLLWQEVVWEAGWGRYREGEMTGHAIVDGGLLSNFPIELLVSRDATVTALMGPDVSEHVLGMLIDESQTVGGAEAASAPSAQFKLGELRTVQRLANLVNTTLSARDKMVIDALEKFVVRLPAGGYGTTEFEMSDERRERLVNAGREAMTAYLESAAATETVSFGVVETREADQAQRAADRLALKMLKL
jgi:predicted acylesterase/phospholipase RssA